jgi:hypothetical protein
LWLLNFSLDSLALAGQLPCYPAKKDSTKADSSAKKPAPCISWPVAKQLTEGDFNVSGFSWNPDGKQIAFNKAPNPLILSGDKADIVIVDIATKKITTLGQ